MIWDKTNEPVLFGPEQLRDVIEEYAAIATKLTDVLHETAANGDETIEWRPHLPQIHAALSHFIETCRDEIAEAANWRADGRGLDEIHELIWNEGERLVQWLRRMFGIGTIAQP